jgi:hypothetical protein
MNAQGNNKYEKDLSIVHTYDTNASSEGQEKYLRELSITPVGYFTGAINKSLPCGVPQELFCLAKMRYFRGTGMIFPRLALL